jgi:KUP system potassium uptake protein
MQTQKSVTLAGLMIALGIIFGDIGTSPLYVFKAIIGKGPIESWIVYGGLSCIFWTLTLQTSIKYVLITLRADNKGEGGVLSLFSLIRRRGKWLVFPAMLGGAALLADGMITPAITISSAVEGLTQYFPQIQTVPLVLTIIVLLFSVQRFGTAVVGRYFGPIMLVWFSMLGVLGILHLLSAPAVLAAINPWYAVKMLIQHPQALLIIGAVFLCTTGAEALYSDLGHCGLKQIQISWIFVKICLLLCYFGQGAWLLAREGEVLNGLNPFYGMMPPFWLPFGIGIATLAAIIASQAMISGAFTLVSEAVRLNLWPKVRIVHPSMLKGQLYVPSANGLLFVGCVFIVLYFQHSSRMEAAYGLAINLSFLVTSVLMTVYLYKRHVPLFWCLLFLIGFFTIESVFLIGNMLKFMHGGWITLLITGLLWLVMWSWWKARKIKNRHTKFVDIKPYFPLLEAVSKDETIPLYASQLVYLTSANFEQEIEEKIIFSMLHKMPKRADIYWLVHVDVTDTPYTGEYKVKHLIEGKLIRIDFRLGFRDEQRISLLFRKVVEELVEQGEVDIRTHYKSLRPFGLDGNFRFVVLHKVLSRNEGLHLLDRTALDIYRFLRRFSLSEEKGFGLDASFVTLERVPLTMETTPLAFHLKRIGSHE